MGRPRKKARFGTGFAQPDYSNITEMEPSPPDCTPQEEAGEESQTKYWPSLGTESEQQVHYGYEPIEKTLMKCGALFKRLKPRASDEELESFVYKRLIHLKVINIGLNSWVNNFELFEQNPQRQWDLWTLSFEKDKNNEECLKHLKSTAKNEDILKVITEFHNFKSPAPTNRPYIKSYKCF